MRLLWYCKLKKIWYLIGILLHQTVPIFRYHSWFHLQSRNSQRLACCNSLATTFCGCCWCAMCSAMWCWIYIVRSEVVNRGRVAIRLYRTRRSWSTLLSIIWFSIWPPVWTHVIISRTVTSSPDPGIFPARLPTWLCYHLTTTITITTTVIIIATIKSLHWDLIKPRLRSNREIAATCVCVTRDFQRKTKNDPEVSNMAHEW